MTRDPLPHGPDPAPTGPAPHGEVEHPDLQRLARARPSRWATAVSEATNPALLVTALTILVAAFYAPTAASAALWAAVAVAFCAVIPYAVLLLLLACGVVTDRHIVRREQRLWPGVAALASVSIGVAVMVWGGAPRPLVALIVAMLAGLVVISLITLRTKASTHVAVTTSTTLIAAGIAGGGAWYAAATALISLVGWARIRGGRHSVPQVAWGLAIGVAIVVGVYRPMSS